MNLRVLLTAAVFLAGSPAAFGQAPVVFSLDGNALAKVKTSLASGTSPFRPAYQKLLRDADKAMQVGLVSVVDKAIVPPSGDKRDYMSQSRYWWPDPTKPDGLPYIRRDGESNPEILKLPDHENLVTMARSVSDLSLAYYLSGEERYARRVAQWVRHWFLDSATAMRPNLQFGQGIPGRSTGRGPGVLDGRHTAVVIDAVGLIGASGHWSSTDDAALRAWFASYVAWLTESEIGKDEQDAPNNHGTWYDAHVLPAAIYAGRAELARLIVEQAPQRRVESQIEPDGSQPKELARTRPYHYSVFNLEAYVRLSIQARHLSIDLWSASTMAGRRLRAAVDYLVPFATGQKTWPLEDLDSVAKGPTAILLVQVYGLTHDPKYRDAARTLGADRAPTHREWLTTGVEPTGARQ